MIDELNWDQFEISPVKNHRFRLDSESFVEEFQFCGSQREICGLRFEPVFDT